MIELRDYQARDIARIRDAYARGVRRVLYVLPTGGGKTVSFCHMAQGASKKNKRTGILVHRSELLRQASKSLECSEVVHGLIAPRYTANKEVVQIASVQTLVRRLNDYLDFAFIIIDEAHHATASTYRKIMEANPNALILGVTATPCRTDESGLGEIFQEMIVGPSISELTDDGYLCRAKIFAPPTQFTLDNIGSRGGDWKKEELAAVMDTPKILGDAVDHYRRLAAGLPAIDFCVSIAHANHSAARFIAGGFRWRVLDGKMSADYREETIKMLGDNRIDGISSCDLISEGTDIPVVSVAIKQRPTQSMSLDMQQNGRVLRPIYAKGFDLKTRQGRLSAIAASSKPYAIIQDHVGNVLRHGMYDMDRDWSLGAKPRKKKNPRYEEEEEIAVRQCPECYHAHKPAKKCPHCGHVYEAVGNMIEHVAGELVEHTRTALETLMRRYKTLEEFKKYAFKNGYTETWAQAAFKKQNDEMRAHRDTLEKEGKKPIKVALGGEPEMKPYQHMSL